MHSRFHFCRTPIALILVLLLSGIPFPFIDSHPTGTANLDEDIHLREHLVQMPLSEHRDVGDRELHVHWICPIVATKCDCDPVVPDSLQHLQISQSNIKNILLDLAVSSRPLPELVPQSAITHRPIRVAFNSSTEILLGTRRLLI